MAHSVGVASNPSPTPSRRIPLILLCLGIALNHTSVVFGINLSAADLITVLLLLVIVLTSKLYSPIGPTVFFIALSILVLLVGGFVTPNVLPISVTTSDVLTDYIKLLTSFCYLLVGFNIARVERAKIVLRAFSLTAALLGLTAVVQSGIPGMPRIEAMFYGEYRFRGLMNDPNYFAVIQLAALAILWHDTSVTRKIRYPALVILSASVLASGSKTGAIALLVFFMWRIFAGILVPSRTKSAGRRLGAIVLVPGLLAGIIVLLADPAWRIDLAARLDQVPALSRLAPLLLDFQSGVEMGGSSRDSAWNNALAIIELSPLTGIGVGTYLETSAVTTGTPVLAHNTFLQIAAEWGLVFAALFFVGVVILIMKRPPDSADIRLWSSTRDAILVMLVGSIGVSLNNARLFWFTLGIILAIHVFSALPQRASQSADLEENNETR